MLVCDVEDLRLDCGDMSCAQTLRLAIIVSNITVLRTTRAWWLREVGMLCMSFGKLYQSRCGPEDVLRRSNLFADRCEVRWDGIRRKAYSWGGTLVEKALVGSIGRRRRLALALLGS